MMKAPTTLGEMIELPTNVQSILQLAIKSSAGGNLLFYGPAGTGKTEFSRVAAMEAMRLDSLAVADFASARAYWNLIVMDHKTGYGSAALEKVSDRIKMGTLSDSARHWVIIEEFDSFGDKLTNHLKTWLSDLMDDGVQVFASTNNLDKIDGAVRSRFSEIYLGPHGNQEMRDWAVAELGRLGCSDVDAATLTALVNAASGSVRTLKRDCYRFSETGSI